MAPSLRRLTVVGLGLIGGSIGAAARARGLAREVVGVDTNPEVAEAARAVGAADRLELDLAAGVDGAELVVLAAPPLRIPELLEALPPLLADDAIVTDVGSVKGEIARRGASLPAFVPGHPMAGSERHGVAASRPDLFEGAVWPLTPTPSTDPAALARVEAFVAALGARPLLLSPQEHDRAVALTSHLPHALAFALYGLARRRAQEGEAHLFDLAAGGFHSATRVAASSPALWRDICLANRQEVLSALRDLERSVDLLGKALETGDEAALLECLAWGHRPIVAKNAKPV